ncbi:plasmid stabilization system [Flavobacterium rivuli WB 3.3-2 = DSM 21788]|uniref:Plasmid stabilization system n=2 Tax=Flavobacterium rivuli TaxID=498301 RepID=A0A0A2M4P8_9FLAO|nr:type II toxin-antitoxin system RelE/ParE family toxin [Flavobacterium rivuli]KGO86438.1 plasmid stabilization system [Flavobacterium rivuli WB 3.3-2 = DSM 21788]
MAFDLEIRDAANLEIINAYLYYEEQQLGLGDRFINILERHFEKISIHPEHYQIKRKPYREAVLSKFPFVIIYQFTNSKIVVFSVFNTHQNPVKKP